MLVAIGVFKLVKVALLVTLGVLGLVGGGQAYEHLIRDVAHWLGAFSGHHAVQRALSRLFSLPEHTLHRFAIASLAYAAVFATEGTGLVLRRPWAEWLTIGATGSFIPVEAYELVHRPSAAKVAALTINVAIVAYLVWLRLEAHRRRTLGPAGPRAG
ncbi:MAG TPA: DUF2127 domain-containing protein [Polyangia bacterium]|jgi:uncharacterized membrane protein (DUF2068 family)|nr:DUF2127 domain-containing protein [Polyangia bacterium]